jgi:hypothetical protein
MSVREMAEQSTIIKAITGSTLHGLALAGTDDRDETGICVESFQAFGGFSEFDQFIYRSAAEREGKHDAPSKPGDLDLTIYSLRKFLRLAMQGNPSVILMLFVQPQDCIVWTTTAGELQDIRGSIISAKAGSRFLGYMEAQRQRLLGERGQKKINRPELEEKYGYDTKYACHIVRLGWQGVELLTTGKLTLPIPEGPRSKMLAIRRGEVPMQDVLQWAGDLERELKDLLTDSILPPEPNRDLVEEWMLNVYLERWVDGRL